MNTRDTFISQLRGQAIGTISLESTMEESFQNETLRPILKLQNDLFTAAFASYIEKNKIDFETKTVEAKLVVIDNAIQKDIKFSNTMRGIIIGLFTAEEYAIYSKNTSSINKRMMSMLMERLKSQVQLF
ncbi:hypothetical protein SAMN05444372_10553 [Flavobacterium micromati]|uniref:Glyoxalase n=1 Tax=Flavobacterium micromati TaxID=229205 RepID=A0A1M5J6H8_9FLAO|nr:glyoxalase [Flavobacterium micromati]SHG35899.1 hypothetical protein SAMN05444372_10553 [Flavobacterium micromati]